MVWETADLDERAALRAEYSLAGWTLCPHSACPSRPLPRLTAG